MEKGTMIRKKPRIGKRINIIVLGHVDNDQTMKLYHIFDKYNLQNRVEFGHYGRPNKAKREFDAWFSKHFGGDTVMNKLVRADAELFGTNPKSKLKRADDQLFKSARKLKDTIRGKTNANTE